MGERENELWWGRGVNCETGRTSGAIEVGLKKKNNKFGVYGGPETRGERGGGGGVGIGELGLCGPSTGGG